MYILGVDMHPSQLCIDVCVCVRACVRACVCACVCAPHLTLCRDYVTLVTNADTVTSYQNQTTSLSIKNDLTFHNFSLHKLDFNVVRLFWVCLHETCH